MKLITGKNFGLRTASKNFSIEQIEEGVKFVHSYKKRVYVTMNIIPHKEEKARIKKEAERNTKRTYKGS